MSYTIEGPFPLTLRPTESGADLDVSRFLVRAVLLQLFADAAEDPAGFGEEFADLYALSQSAQFQGRDSHARHEFDERVDKLCGAFGDGRIDLYATGLRQLRDALDEVLKPREIPTQREAGAA
jgi:hypothetical protein